MNIFDKLKDKLNNRQSENISYCKRCHSKANIDELGYCKECALIKSYIEKSTSQESLMNNKSPYVLDLYYKIKESTAFNYNKLDIENAEIVDNLNGIEKKFLEYMDSKCVEKFDLAGYWIYEYFIDCNYLISKLIKNGYLVISEYRKLSNLSTDELKNMLKNHNLKVSGSKTDLIKRIEENISPDEINSEIVNGQKYFVLTEKGYEIKEKTKNSIAIDFEEKCYNLILENKLQEAYNMVCEYESKKLVKRGINCDWNNTQRKFNLSIDTLLPFKLPNFLLQYEKELKATAIYSEMMGVNPTKAVSFFCNKHTTDIDREIISNVLNALYALAQGVVLTNEHISKIENIETVIQKAKSVPKSTFEELSIDKFYDTLKQKVTEACLVDEDLSIDQLKDGTYNFCYEDFQIGRVKFAKRSSSMQILSGDDVIWLKNETIETYLKNIDKWVDYIKYVKSRRDCL